ncbi:cellulose binding domain-containing protein [Actinoplanes couchii]|uniref:CBM2 domain-containing protein n=1 Tax=Actinoplanes couchii TaxID=403638 RepID=A0ABQ3XBI6_9ACTN|nr:cellulose binding domain-containing protein [Actinoplanes couchii]MDR6323340.1 hypothetical protein [Actinoplanes couchii]GID55853.1 hypothetical protein Aco03nite_042570 [Actinoplanes couchii]
MAKHAPRHVLLSRVIFGSASAILLGLVGWVAVRAGGGDAEPDGKPLMVLPTGVVQAAAEGSLPPLPPTESDQVSPSVSVSARASRSPSPSVPASRTPSVPASASPSASVKPSKSTSKPSAGTSPSRTVAPPPADTIAATYSTSASWRDGFITAIRVVNTGTAARDFTITLTYPSSADVEVRGAWNASASGNGGTVTLRGGTLPAGGSINVGFQAEKRSRDLVKPVSCTVGGGSCKVS